MTPKTEATKEKVDRLDSIKMKDICASKDTLKKMKGQPTAECEKIFANDII